MLNVDIYINCGSAGEEGGPEPLWHHSSRYETDVSGTRRSEIFGGWGINSNILQLGLRCVFQPLDATKSSALGL